MSAAGVNVRFPSDGRSRLSLQLVEEDDALSRARLENETLYAVIKTVSSSLDLDRVLHGIVDIATDATASHACFIYFAEGERLVLRAASPRYARFVGELSLGIDEGLAGWVARNKTPEFIRENAMADPRMKFVPELEEEELPVDGRGADPRQVRRRDRRRRPAHRGAAGVRGRRPQLPRPHGVAGGRRDRERAALRGHQAAGPGPDHADPAEPGARGGHRARGPLRGRGPRRSRAAARGRLPDPPPRRRRRRADPRQLRPRRAPSPRARDAAEPGWSST